MRCQLCRRESLRGDLVDADDRELVDITVIVLHLDLIELGFNFLELFSCYSHIERDTVTHQPQELGKPVSD